MGGATACLGDAFLPRNRRHRGDDRAWTIEGSNTIVQKTHNRRKFKNGQFAMDSVFGEDVDTHSIYEETTRPIVQSVVSGRHGTVFAYGQTGSGKTFTMQGGQDGTEHEGRGITQMAMIDLFESIASSNSREWKVQVQYYEIYNEEVRDLLAAVPEVPRRRRSSRKLNGNASSDSFEPQSFLPTLKVLEDKNGNVKVNAMERTVSTAEECIRFLHKGNLNRASAATDANQHSSRSHAIFRVTLKSWPKTEDHIQRVSVLNLVDLAGSENGRVTSNASQARKREGGKINQSLLSLSRVIHALSLEEGERPVHIGFRDSKLTRILRPHLSGNACIAILCCASSHRRDLEESISTFRFAASAKEIKIRPEVNEYVDEKESLMRLQNELAEVKHALQAFEARYSQEQAVYSIQSSTPPMSRPIAMGRIGTVTTVTTNTNSSVASSMETNDLAQGVDSSRNNGSRPATLPASYQNHPMSPSYISPDSSPEADHILVGPPVAEVEIRNTHEQHSSFLEERIEATENMMEQLHAELNQSRHSLLETIAMNKELQEKLDWLHQEMDEKRGKEELLSSWYFFACIMLYAFKLHDLFVASILFFWLSMQTIEHTRTSKK